MLAVLIINRDDKTGKTTAFAYGNTKEGTKSVYNSFIGSLDPYRYVGGYENPATLEHMVRAYEVLKEESGE